MQRDPIDTAPQSSDVAARDAASSRLNMLVAITVAVLATFMGICKVKDDNIVQAMQQAQANKLDHWAFYQARNVREEVSKAALVQLELAAAGAPPSNQARYAAAIGNYAKIALEQGKKKEELKQLAAQDQKEYDAANYRDDQFDLSDAFLALTVAMLAVTSLTQQRWLYAGAMVPTAFGVVMGLAGLCGWAIHPAWLTGLLT